MLQKPGMGNKKARQAMLQQQDALAWERSRTEARNAVDDICARGIGHRRLQLIVAPSFEKGCAWEIRQLEDKWTLFRSEVLGEGTPIALRGYELISVEGSTLHRQFRKAISLSFPLEPDLSNRFGCDGTIFQLAVFGDAFTECRVQWWSDPPPQWRPLADLALEMIAIFSAAK